MTYQWRTFWWHSKSTVAHWRTLCLNDISFSPMRCHQELQWTDSLQNCVRKSKDCEFGRLEDDMMRDKLVFSINDPRLKERLLCENGLALQRAIEICRSTKLAKTKIQVMQMTPVTYDASIDSVEKTKGHKQTSSRFNKCKKQTTVNCQKCEETVWAPPMPSLRSSVTNVEKIITSPRYVMQLVRNVTTISTRL